jgi:hypothetical protein
VVRNVRELTHRGLTAPFFSIGFKSGDEGRSEIRVCSALTKSFTMYPPLVKRRIIHHNNALFGGGFGMSSWITQALKNQY